MSCRTSWRGDAPSATRTAISRSRDRARVSSSEATLMTAISEQQGHGAEQHHQRGTVVAECSSSSGTSRVPQPRLVCGLGLNRPVQRIGRGLGLLDRDVGLQARHGLHEVRRAAVLRHVPPQALPHVHVVRVVEPGRHHPDDDVGRVVEQQWPPDDRRVGAVARPPEPVADHGDQLARREERSACREAVADLRRDAEHANRLPLASMVDHADRLQSRIDEVDARAPPGGGVLEHRQRPDVHEVDRRDRVVAERLSPRWCPRWSPGGRAPRTAAAEGRRRRPP